jgi:hypothetical protein
VIDHLMTQTLSVWRSTDVEDAGGGLTKTTVQVDTIRAKVNQPTPEEIQAAGAWGARLSHVVHTPVYNDVRRGDEFGGETPSEVLPGFRLRVISVVSDSHQTYRRAMCETTQAVNDTEDGSSS